MYAVNASIPKTLVRHLVRHHIFERSAARVQLRRADHRHGGVLHPAHGKLDLRQRQTLVRVFPVTLRVAFKRPSRIPQHLPSAGAARRVCAYQHAVSHSLRNFKAVADYKRKITHGRRCKAVNRASLYGFLFWATAAGA